MGCDEGDMGQVGGQHYQKGIQPVEAMPVWMSKEEVQGFYWGNVIKYVARWKDKNGIEDLQKAKDYLERLIELQGNKNE
jgi:hypothetical protein